MPPPTQLSAWRVPSHTSFSSGDSSEIKLSDSEDDEGGAAKGATEGASTPLTREALMDLPLRELKELASTMAVSTEGCLERSEIVEQLLQAAGAA